MTMTLEEAIAQRINLGDKDPLTIARKIIENHDDEWLVEELTGLAEDLIAEMSRRRLGDQRRRAEVALRPGDPVSTGELKLRSVWVPGESGGDWKRAADVTAEDAEAKARWYLGLARAAQRRAMWWLDVAGMIRADGVANLGALKRDLPVLPGDEDLGELVA